MVSEEQSEHSASLIGPLVHHISALCMVGWSLHCISSLLAETGGKVGPERWRVEPVDDGVTAGVKVPKHEKHVVNIFWRHTQHVGLEPVPDP